VEIGARTNINHGGPEEVRPIFDFSGTRFKTNYIKAYGALIAN